MQLGRGRTFDGLDGSTGHEAAMDQQLARPRWAFRLFGPMFAIFAVIALALSSVGLYAVMAYSVAQRTQEIGVRMAFGAQATLVLWLILRQSLVQLAVGIGGACGGGRLLDSVLVQSGSRELVTLTSIVALLVVVSLAESARQAIPGGAITSSPGARSRENTKKPWWPSGCSFRRSWIPLNSIVSSHAPAIRG